MTRDPGMANLTKSVLHKLVDHAIRMGYRNDNPVTHIERYKGGSHHTWTEDELAAYKKNRPLGAGIPWLCPVSSHRAAWRRHRKDATGRHPRVAQSGSESRKRLVLWCPFQSPTSCGRPFKAGPSNGLHLIGDPSGRPISRSTLSKLVKKAAKAAGFAARM